ncbi:MAG TPA: hypothetical protein VN622_01625 [Clostridia bacterium]|nr:hypothetical protein [Clostridia bacterium]
MMFLLATLLPLAAMFVNRSATWIMLVIAVILVLLILRRRSARRRA